MWQDLVIIGLFIYLFLTRVDPMVIKPCHISFIGNLRDVRAVRSITLHKSLITYNQE
jgi:hypothetical protein